MRKSAYTRKSKASDVKAVAAAMRKEDVSELAAGEGLEPDKALLFCFMAGKPCMTICDGNGQPVGMWGVTPDAGKVGRVWLLGTDDLVTDTATRLRFLREAKAYVQELLKTYAVLWNCVDARNTVHVRWIEWMGFTFVAKHPNYGAEGRLFLEFCQVSPCALQPL